MIRRWWWILLLPCLAFKPAENARMCIARSGGSFKFQRPVMSEEADAGQLNNIKQHSVLLPHTTSSPLFWHKEGQQRWSPSASITYNSLFCASKLELLHRGLNLLQNSRETSILVIWKTVPGAIYKWKGWIRSLWLRFFDWARLTPHRGELAMPVQRKRNKRGKTHWLFRHGKRVLVISQHSSAPGTTTKSTAECQELRVSLLVRSDRSAECTLASGFSTVGFSDPVEAGSFHYAPQIQLFFSSKQSIL